MMTVRPMVQMLLDWKKLDTSLVEKVRQPDLHRIEMLAASYAEGYKVPPIVVLSDKTTVVDGLHRIEAHRRWEQIIQDKPVPDTIWADIIDVPPDKPDKWLLIVEYNSPTQTRPLSAAEVARAIQNYLAEVPLDTNTAIKKMRRDLSKWADGIGVPKRVINDVLLSVGLTAREAQQPRKAKSTVEERLEEVAASPPAPAMPAEVQLPSVQVPLIDLQQMSFEAATLNVINGYINLKEVVGTFRSHLATESFEEEIGLVWTVAESKGLATALEEAVKELVDITLLLASKR